MHQPSKAQPRRRYMLPLVLLAIIFAVFFVYCKLTNGWALANPSFPIYPPGAGYEEKLQILSRSTPAVKKILNHIDEYPEEILDLLLRNPETMDFVSDYPKNKNGSKDKPNISEEIKHEKVPHFLQWDKRWGYDSYGNSCIAISGCGPTCLSMVYTALTKNSDYDPKTMAAFSSRNGYYIEGSGTSWELMTNGARQLGLSSRELSLSASGIKEALNSGKLIIASLGPGDFTTSGHFIVICSTDKTGNFRVLDPNSKEKSKKTWSYEKLSEQILNLWTFSK